MNNDALATTSRPITAARVAAERDANGGTMVEAKERLLLTQKTEVRIENWCIEGHVLFGDAIDHPVLGNAWVRTSTIQSANITTKRVVTRNTVYLLGKPAERRMPTQQEWDSAEWLSTQPQLVPALAQSAPQPGAYQHAYEGAMEEVAIWKKRALEAEAKLANPVLTEVEQYRMQMAGISTAALGYWKEGDTIHPDYDTLALRDVAKLYAKYDTLFKAQPDLGTVIPAVKRSIDDPDVQKELHDAAYAGLAVNFKTGTISLPAHLQPTT